SIENHPPQPVNAIATDGVSTKVPRSCYTLPNPNACSDRRRRAHRDARHNARDRSRGGAFSCPNHPGDLANLPDGGRLSSEDMGCPGHGLPCDQDGSVDTEPDALYREAPAMSRRWTVFAVLLLAALQVEANPLRNRPVLRRTSRKLAGQI